MRTLSHLLQGFPDEIHQGLLERDYSLRIRAVTSDSRQVRPGALFVAVRGGQSDGHAFIEQAKDQGAVAIAGEAELSSETKEALGIPYLCVPDARRALARFAANFYENPSRAMVMIGVTGTSGKTTTTYLIEAILKAAGHRVGVIGTVNCRYENKIIEATHTTPGPVELQQVLAEMKEAHCSAVVMEVSSHALKQHRTAEIAFDGMIFTNLTPEHLDYHPDMEDYYRAKSLLFTDMVDSSIASGKRPFAAVNADCEYGKRLLVALKNRARQAASPGSEFAFASYGMNPGADVFGGNLRVDLEGVHGPVTGRFPAVELRSPMTGRFNAYNILAAITVTSGLKDPPAPSMIGSALQDLKQVPGRLERVPDSAGIHVLVDYAHKPDALEKVLKTLGEVKGAHRLITVFGCGGDRDRKKRPVMGKMAVELSDQVVLTSDNPRTEDPLAIIEEIRQGMTGASNYVVEPDRRKAIFLAIQKAEKGDIVLIAGKGHEDYQIIADPSSPGGTRKIHFDDRVVAAGALQTKK